MQDTTCASEALSEALVVEQVESGTFNIVTMTFAELEQVSHELGRHLSRRLRGSFVSNQAGRMSPDYDYPT